ncbi:MULTISPECIES: retron St85 family RNA-directed DNA polymerase [Methylotenera]|uniref:retron St85 family RNA-directed DNA polymerase n=1 Tax=Methylotenera TaxID=359407 RepID=UPI00037DD2C4|nr:MULTISPECIES: retron St85 family RNA-directed DNA polymerase [Methylotenera]
MSIFNRMLTELPYSKDELLNLIATAQFRYKVYKIPKRKPNQFRTIAQPSPEIKLIQRWLVKSVLADLPLHKVATAYRKGKSIADHANLHKKYQFLLKMDFKDFFPSINVLDVRNYLIETANMSEDDARLVSSLVCWKDKEKNRLCLSIGAPSSPHLSNIIMYEFDEQVSIMCKELNVSYSRYADDLAFSTSQKNVLEKIPNIIKNICLALEYPKLIINDSKTVSTSRAKGRVVVGLVLTSEGNISLGREKKRQLRYELYKFSKGVLDHESISKLRGDLAFVWSVEERFIHTLLRQFGNEVFTNLELPFQKAD